MPDFNTLLPEEENYAEFMTETVEPYLSARRTEGYVQTRDGKSIHYEYTENDHAIGAIVISHGFTESAEKFRELSYWFMQMGYSVYALDHRGHGLSYRSAEETWLTDVDHFSDYVNDLNCFMRKVVLPGTKGMPRYLFGHSMGGAVAILYVQAHPHVFDKVILNAPMVKPQTDGIPSVITKLLSDAFRIGGKGDRLVFARKAGFNENEYFENSPDTSFARFEYYRKKRVLHPHLQNTAPTYRWLNESLRMTKKMLDRERCAKVTCPVLLISAGNDLFVFRREQEIFVSRIPNGKIIYEERAKHEIYMSEKHVMKDYLAEIEGFLA